MEMTILNYIIINNNNNNNSNNGFLRQNEPLMNKSIIFLYHENTFSLLPFEYFQASKEAVTKSTRGMYTMLLQIYK